MIGFQSSPHDMEWFAERHRALVADLAGTLDLDTGLRDITVADSHRSVAADLSEVLDLDAGLSAILPVRESPATEPTVLPTSPNHPLVSLASLVNAIAEAPPATRLTLRAHTLSLVGAIELVAAVGEARRLARAIDLDRAILLAQARVESLALALARKISMARTMLVFVGSIEVSAASSLRDLVDNMMGADLHNVELARVTLDGVRWSDTTRWPARWSKHIRRNSVGLGNGVYEYRPGMTHIDNSLTLIVQ